MSLNGNNLCGPPQSNNRNKRVKLDQGDQNAQKDDLGDYQGREGDEQHGRSGNKMNRICRDFVRGLCRRKYCRVSRCLKNNAFFKIKSFGGEFFDSKLTR